MGKSFQDIMDEKEFERRLLMHKRLRKLLLFINLLFALYLSVQIVKVCYKKIDSNTVPNYSHKIDNIMNDGANPYRLRSTPVRDFLVYGDSLNLYYYDYEVSSTNDNYVSPTSKFVLRNLKDNKEYIFNTSIHVDNNIMLSTLDVGTYVIFYYENDNVDDMIVTHESYNKGREYTTYSLPYKVNNKMVHKKIVIGASYSNSFPVFTITVSEEKMLDNKRYDIAINYEAGTKCEAVAKYLKNRFAEINVNVYLNKESTSSSSKASFYKFVYDNDIKFAIDLNSENSNRMTYIHSYKSYGYLSAIDVSVGSEFVEENGDKLDKDLFIRELGGRVTGAGICKEGSGTLSCAMGDRKNEMGVDAVSITIGNKADDIMLNHFGSTIYASFMNKYGTYLQK